MSQLYGIGLNCEMNNINVQLKLHIAAQKGKVTTRNLLEQFRQVDTNQVGHLDPEQLEKALANFGFFLKRVQYQTIFKAYGENTNGVVNYQDFVNALREPLSERRLKLVFKVWDQLDCNEQGFLSFLDFQKQMDASAFPDVKKGTCTADEAVNFLWKQFDLNQDGCLTKEEFIQYYEELGVAIRSDNYFIEVVGLQWGVEEENQSIISEQEIKNIVKILRYKLIQMTQGISDEFLLKKIFNEFDTNKNGNLTLEELYAMTIKLEVPIHKQYLSALFKKFDRNDSGFIEFDEFLYFLTYDPYP